MILGDVLATIAVIVFSGLAAWAGSVLSAILFPVRMNQAAADFEERPWITFLIGLGLMLPIALLGIVAFGPAPTRPFGFFIFSAMLGIAVFGTGGLVRLIGKRILENGGAQSEFAAFAKGGALVVAAELLPVFGWFLLMPYVVIAAFGTGFLSLFRSGRKRVTIAVPPAETP